MRDDKGRRQSSVSLSPVAPSSLRACSDAVFVADATGIVAKQKEVQPSPHWIIKDCPLSGPAGFFLGQIVWIVAQVNTSAAVAVVSASQADCVDLFCVHTASIVFPSISAPALLCCSAFFPALVGPYER